MTKPPPPPAKTTRRPGESRSRRPAARDTDTTPFTTILESLIERVPGAYACALVDVQGECVDYGGCIDPFDARVAGAHLRIALDQIDRFGALGAPRWLVVRGAKGSAVVRALPDRYGLVLLLRRRAGFTASSRAFAVCEQRLAEEAGWSRDARTPLWFPIDVETNRRGRPLCVGPAALGVEVLGAIVGLAPHERGFRVRTARGTELTLVREALRRWYADAELDGLVAGSSLPPAGTREPR